MTTSSPAAAPENLSPCIGVCAMDSAGLCRGCARTLQEIGAWLTLPFAARQELMNKLPARKSRPAVDNSGII